MAKPTYSKPTAQVDLEERMKDDYVVPTQLQQGSDPEPSETGFVGVDPIYQNFANDTEKPLRAEKGVEKKLEDVVYADEVDEDFGAPEKGSSGAKEESKPTSPSGSSTTPPSGSSTTPPSGSSTTPPSGGQSGSSS